MTNALAKKVVSKKLLLSGRAPFVRLDATPRRFTKEVLRVGSWLHPGTAEELNFSTQDLLDLASSTNEWIAAGNKVWFPTGTPAEDKNHNAAAIANLGFWTNFRLEGDRLMADVEVLDESAVSKVGKTIQDVSVGIRGPQLVQDGRALHAVIYHVAATPQPAIPGQSNFQMKLSQEGEQERVFVSKQLEAPPVDEKKPGEKPAAPPADEKPPAATQGASLERLCSLLEQFLGGIMQPPAAPGAQVQPVALEATGSNEVLKKIASLELENAVLRDKGSAAAKRIAVVDVIASLEREGFQVGPETKKVLEARAARGEPLDGVVATLKVLAPKLPASPADVAARERVLEANDVPEVLAYPESQRETARNYVRHYELIQQGGGKPLRMDLKKFLEKNVGALPARKA